jgi:hypothetical protein
MQIPIPYSAVSLETNNLCWGVKAAVTLSGRGDNDSDFCELQVIDI